MGITIMGCGNPLSKKNKAKNVLIYTKNGKGYVHDNIASSVKCLEKDMPTKRLDVSYHGQFLDIH